ncbi:MAG TPA: AzlC family ABC transporter permease [Xanthobacteraceae bacterium]|jgi:4-azaleucine resistance transporter AzlC|nr:AzlC family ABC transporter permease [Xanthobacteraceae bacterium]
MVSNSNSDDAPYWSRAGLVEGVRLTLPALPSVTVFAAAFGTLAAQKGLSFIEATVMSAAVYAGMAQLVAMGIWADSLTLAAVTALFFVTLAVNMRFVLMGASLRPWLGKLPGWQVYPSLYLLTDVAWLVATRYRAGGRSDASVFLGSAAVLWVVWVAATMPGYLLGAMVSDPRRLGLDLVMPSMFVAMLVPLWRGARRAMAWLVAGVAAVAASYLIPGYWFIVIGAIAGSLTGGLVDGDD